MLSEADLQRQVHRYLAGELSLEAFEDWLVAESWNFHKGPNAIVLESLVGPIELRLAEYSCGHLSEGELRSELRQLIGADTVWVSPGPIILRSDAPGDTQFATAVL